MHQRGGDGDRAGVHANRLAKPGIGGVEEELFVARRDMRELHRSAPGDAVLVLVLTRLAAGHCGKRATDDRFRSIAAAGVGGCEGLARRATLGGKGPGVKIGIAEKPIDGAMVLGAAGLGGQAQDAGALKLGGVAAGKRLDLVDAFQGNHVVNVSVLGLSARDGHCHPVKVHLRGALRHAVELGDASPGGQLRARQKVREGRNVALLCGGADGLQHNRQLREDVAPHQAAEVGIRGLKSGRRIRDGDGHTLSADLQYGIEGGDVFIVDDEVFLIEHLKTRLRRRHGVFSRSEQRDAEESGRGGRTAGGNAGAYIRGRNGCIGDDRAVCIGHCPFNGATGLCRGLLSRPSQA